MRIPEIRDRLHALADDHNIPELHHLAEETRRRSPLKRASAKYPALTEEQAGQVRSMYRTRRSLGVRDLANMFGTSVGRVSEAIRGFRA